MVKLWFCRAKLGRIPLELSPTETIGQVKSRLPGDKSSGSETLIFFKGSRLADTSKIGELGLQDNDQLILLQSRTSTVQQLKPSPIPLPLIAPAPVPQATAPLPANMQQMISQITEAFASSVTQPAPQPILPNFFGPPIVPPIIPSYIPPPVAAAPPRTPTHIPEENLQMLISMGFPEGRCRKALLLNRLDVSAATDWLIEHIEDPEADTPLTQQELSRLGLH